MSNSVNGSIIGSSGFTICIIPHRTENFQSAPNLVPGPENGSAKAIHCEKPHWESHSENRTSFPLRYIFHQQ